MSKTAIVLFNLGGPDSLKAVRPFLFNLFNDRAIISLPQPFRACVAFLISALRARKARGIYAKMGGKSPILDITNAQAEALEALLQKKASAGDEYKVFVSMRHWHPMSRVVVRKVKAYAPDNVALLPLYPQYSTTTTASSIADWKAACKKLGLDVPTTAVCCYPQQKDFIISHAHIVRDMYWKASEEGKPRVLFSAHGLPEKIIAGGDPYQWQVEKTVEAIVQLLTIDEMDYGICYQSRVGPMAWIGPSTEEEIVNAAEQKKPILVVPVAFVSEHSETLVELDMEYRDLAQKAGAPGYWRAPALGVDAYFIEALAGLCLGADKEKAVCSFAGMRQCPSSFGKCPC